MLAPNFTHCWVLIQASMKLGMEKTECAAELSQFSSETPESKCSRYLAVPHSFPARKIKLNSDNCTHIYTASLLEASELFQIRCLQGALKPCHHSGAGRDVTEAVPCSVIHRGPCGHIQ